jgi:hypothetical protein
MPALNAEWHREHVLGSTAPMDDRVAWHLEHARECGCRDIPASVVAELERRGLDPPGGGRRPAS